MQFGSLHTSVGLKSDPKGMEIFNVGFINIFGENMSKIRP
ncbi:protein of unknown function [Methanocaldococcus lauensis]|uniref:Biopterin-dependent aromatic amino acid hydroxylase family profile domain-containing protein n=1 Tax=Methanocaldococcus lauensis TaxID=2546128 RepID=A0A8D6PV22_9EURY|nr:protein of unknown function [Methanocaldococcus lauensis]